ncbi:MAG TPA: heterodisulfide reductase-related iron-sulfur binding cluster [Candidatus Thermoplasmatota archaeon]|nr:heterodisulfide reductase-related iron-sulfur binding cluster [Candidatus Thermoplasmatota archaeon]
MADECPNYPDQPCRVNLDLMPGDTALWMYILTGVALAVFFYGFYEMVKVWRLGKPFKPVSWKVGLPRLFTALATHRKFQQQPRPGTMHAWVFFGFVVLFIGTLIVAVDADLFEHLLKAKLLFGTPYLLYELVLDAFGVVFLLGTAFLFVRRYGDKPVQLHPWPRPEVPKWLRFGGDSYALLFLFGIGVTGFLLEAMRLRYQVMHDGITYASWSFVGNALGLTMRGLTEEQLLMAYPAFWWLHFALWSSVLAVLPWTKLKHIVTSSLNIYFHDPGRQSRPELPTPFNLPKMMAENVTDFPPVGVSTIRDFTWKDRLSFDACTNCGRCESMCPATAAGRPLSPRKLIQDLKAEMWRDYRQHGSATKTDPRAGAGGVPHQVGTQDAGATDNTGPTEGPRKLASADGIGAALQEATLWSCTTCRACVTECPVDIEHVDLIVSMRRALVMESRLDENQQRLLVNMTNAGNPYGFPASDRADWTAKLPDGVFVPTAAEKAAKGEKAEYLWWIGCSGSFDPRNQQVTRSIATLLNAAKVDFAILGNEERCNGDPARRMGEEGRFQQSVMENLVTFQQHQKTFGPGAAEAPTMKVIAQCPHCLNALGNEYREFGANLEVVHHTQLLEKLLAEGRIPLKAGAELKITYHDSCYLMRHNGIADAPRNVLKKANNGLPVLEMAQSGKQGLCCGAGGANMWYEVKPEGTRINVIRAKQAADTGADTVATACPFCLTMMTDGLNLTGQEGKMQARDLAEILVDHLDWTPPAPPTPPVQETPVDAGGGGGWSG